MSDHSVIQINPLQFPWECRDPFLFCVHHQDAYPRGNGALGPNASLAGRQIGSDFSRKDGWNMYHGQRLPGFPAHPHRGFETVTIVRQGLVDHADSLGAAGRYGDGDVQWLTTGKGVQHSEMFPLPDTEADNPLELFQIWLNLPAAGKMAEPHFRMLWRETIPHIVLRDEEGKAIKIELIAGRLEGQQAPDPTPDSWAADADHHVAIWIIHMDAAARWQLPAGVAGLNRRLYFYQGEALTLAGESIAVQHSVDVQSDQAVNLHNGHQPASLLLLQGRPIGEPVVQHGPFVMNSAEEIQQAFRDYRQTEFGGWPWPSAEPNHGTRGRFARHTDGEEEQPRGEGG